MTNPVGRPRIIASPEQFDERVDNYIEMCQKSEPPQPLTLTGLILALGLGSRESLDNYMDYPEYFDSVKRAKMLIEHEYEKRLVNGTNAAAPIFALKNFGWSDKQEIDTRHSGGIKLDVQGFKQAAKEVLEKL